MRARNKKTASIDIQKNDSIKLPVNGINGHQATKGFEKLTEAQISSVLCFSHLRWDFVFQRPQHLLTRWAKDVGVYYFEEPIFGDFETDTLQEKKDGRVTVLTPLLKHGMSENEISKYTELLLRNYIKANNINNYIAWYYTPMALTYTASLKPTLVIYDCMDELSGFKGAHPDLTKNERKLMKYADVVFTGGHHLYEHKKSLHDNIHPFPSSIDQEHFESGIGKSDPEDQKHIPHPRAGFFGVIDERLDIDLLGKLAQEMSDFHFVMIGPVVKIDPADLPKNPNIHYLGQKNYKELPRYLANWDIAILPFAKNDSTKFISPTKTPEYLAAGKPVVSTSIRDVVQPYGEKGLVQIADEPKAFADAIRFALQQREDEVWIKKVTDNLKTNSWDITYDKMRKIVGKSLMQKDKIEDNLFQLNLTPGLNNMGMRELKNLNNETS